jgi:hypothetical protein
MKLRVTILQIIGTFLLAIITVALLIHVCNLIDMKDNISKFLNEDLIKEICPNCVK